MRPIFKFLANLFRPRSPVAPPPPFAWWCAGCATLNPVPEHCRYCGHPPPACACQECRRPVALRVIDDPGSSFEDRGLPWA